MALKSVATKKKSNDAPEATESSLLDAILDPFVSVFDIFTDGDSDGSSTQSDTSTETESPRQTGGGSKKGGGTSVLPNISINLGGILRDVPLALIDKRSKAARKPSHSGTATEEAGEAEGVEESAEDSDTEDS